MFRNYFYLLRAIRDLDSLLRNSAIREIYTQEKDKLYFHIPLPLYDNFHLVFSAHPQLSCISISKNHRKARKNTINFFGESLPARIRGFSIADKDRLIRINLNADSIYFPSRGASSNVILITEDGRISSFKKMGDAEISEFNTEIKNTVFVDATQYDFSIYSGRSAGELKSIYPFISKDIIAETEKGKTPAFVINEILSDDIAVLRDAETNKLRLVPVGFSEVSTSSGKKIFGDYFEAVNFYLSEYFKNAGMVSVRGILIKYLSKELLKLSNKLNDLKARIETGSREDLYYSYGNLLLANISVLQKGMKKIALPSPDPGEETNIILDEKISPQQNIERYFEKAKSEKINYRKSVQLFNSVKKEYEKLKVLENTINLTDDYRELEKIKKELNIKMGSEQILEENDASNFRRFIIAGKYQLFVGKDSRNNDMLTTKFAKQNDYWFHARGVAGSHAVLRIENTKEPVPKNVLKIAASVAAFYSKAKTAGLVPVSYTLKKFVYKKKGLEPGQVLLSKENTLLVRPEIPDECEKIDP